MDKQKNRQIETTVLHNELHGLWILQHNDIYDVIKRLVQPCSAHISLNARTPDNKDTNLYCK